MLKVVNVPIDVDRRFVAFENGLQTSLQVEAFGIVLACLGIYWVVSEHYHPILGGFSEHLVESLELLFRVLLNSIGVLVALFAITIDERSGVEAHYSH